MANCRYTAITLKLIIESVFFPDRSEISPQPSVGVPDRPVHKPINPSTRINPLARRVNPSGRIFYHSTRPWPNLTACPNVFAMSPRPNRTDPTSSTPLDSVKYAVGILAALLLVPAFLQGVLAFLQTFLQTLLSIVLTLNLLMLSAVAGVAGVWVWQRRAVTGEAVTIEPNPIAPSANQEPLAPEHQGVGGLDRSIERSINRASRTIASGSALETIIVTLPEVQPEARSPTPSHPTSVCPEPLIQAQLARRLGVSSSTIGVRKLKSDFTAWSSQKDPAGLAWRYCEEERLFVAEAIAVPIKVQG